MAGVSEPLHRIKRRPGSVRGDIDQFTHWPICDGMRFHSSSSPLLSSSEFPGNRDWLFLFE